MGLSQSLYTGYSGLHTHQKGMDNLSNNLANVNTVGYKKTNFLFNSLFNKAITGSYPADGDRSTTNPKGVGMGVTTGGIVRNFGLGPTEQTGDPLHCAIGGNGFFVVSTPYGTALTRDGAFYLDHTINPGERMLCLGDGLSVQGWMARNGDISPSQTVGNIYLPAEGDLLPGNVTSELDLKGILPTNTSGRDFTGNQSLTLSLNGNISDGQSLETVIYAPVTRTDGSASSGANVEEVKVRLDFSGPTLSADGTTNTYTWTMTTVDWPSVGDPGVQIYPTAEDPEFQRGVIDFYTQGSVQRGHGAGEAVSGTVTPGSTRVSADSTDPEGNAFTSFFTIPADFKLDVSRMTDLDSPPVSGGAEVWHVDGNPAGTMPRTVTVFDEVTSFVEDNGQMVAVRRVEARENTLYFAKTGSDNAGTDWTWTSSADGASGSLRFDTHGELVSSSQSGGGIEYTFSDIRYLAQDGSLQAIGQDGYIDGTLDDITIDQNGRIWGRYTNEVSQLLAQLAIGNVANPTGLNGASGTLFYPGVASGDIVYGIAGDAVADFGIPSVGAGELRSGVLEGSNVELAREFTTLIQIERGYQFNSRIVTTSDEMLQTALQLKR